MQDQRMQQRGNGSGRGSVPGPGQIMSPADVFKEKLKEKTNELALLIPRRIRREFPPQRIMVVAVRAYATMLANQRDDATPPDIWSTIDAVMRMAQLGLEAGTEQAYLVPYKGKIQPIVGPRGYTDLFLRHPKARSCVARVVLAGDDFDYDLGTSRITHRKGRHPIKQEERAASVEHAYMRYETTNGGGDIEVLTRDDIEFYRSFSAAANAAEGPWRKNYEGMCRKTVLKRGLQYAPRDTFLSLALCEDEGGGYDPKLSTDEIRDAIDSGDAPIVQVPATLPEPIASASQALGAERAGREEPVESRQGATAPTRGRAAPSQDDLDPNNDGR